MAVCEKCWNDAYDRMSNDTTKSQTEHYLDLLKERKDHPCLSPSSEEPLHDCTDYAKINCRCPKGVCVYPGRSAAPSEEVKQGVDAMMKTLEDRENAFIQAYNFLHEDDEDCPKLTSESLGDSDFEDEMDLCELYYQIRTGKIKF